MSNWKLTGLGLLVTVGLLSFLPRDDHRSFPSPISANVEPTEKAVPDIVLANVDEPFRCTIYYTPRESGFVAGEGFDVTPGTRPGLKGKEFGKDFLNAVEKEGFGRLTTPIEGKSYVRYAGGTWAFAETPLDSRSQPLVPKCSCAIKPGHKLIRRESKFKICGLNVPTDLTRLLWVVTDTGSGLEHGQLDLYWGEDDPFGPGRRISRPKTGPATIEQASLMVLR